MSDNYIVTCECGYSFDSRLEDCPRCGNTIDMKTTITDITQPPTDAKWGVKTADGWQWFTEPDFRNIALEVVDSRGYVDNHTWEILSRIAYEDFEEEE